MKFTIQYLLILASTLVIAGWAEVAQAQTTELNIGGSSAGRNFATDVPLNLCDAAPIPTRYSTQDGNKIVWICNRLGAPVIIRYAATSSSEGINKLLLPTGNPNATIRFYDHTLTFGCTGPVLVTRPSDGKQYNVVLNCSNTSDIALPVHIGASDVQGATFHQTGPIGTSITPLDDSTLNSVQTAVVPFSLFVGRGVVKLDAAGTSPNGPISGLSRMEIEAIFNRGVTDWKRLGFGTVTDAAPTTLEATSPIVLCLRSAGSGTKAAFDEIAMINANETSVANANVIFSTSSSGVLSCLSSFRRSIGYMNADQAVSFQYIPPTPNSGLAYPIRIEGALANDPSLTDPKRDLKCGKYPYWAAWRLNRRAGSEGFAIDALAQAFVDNAGLQATISIIPTGAYWASDEEMAVFKNQDRGPIAWKSGDHSECR